MGSGNILIKVCTSVSKTAKAKKKGLNLYPYHQKKVMDLGENSHLEIIRPSVNTNEPFSFLQIYQYMKRSG